MAYAGSEARAGRCSKSLGREPLERPLEPREHCRAASGLAKAGLPDAGASCTSEQMEPTSLARLTLVLGGARSGKSRYAEELVLASGLAPVYVATAEALDDEMAARIAEHKRRRGDRWRTVEEPLELVGVVQRECGPRRAVLVDCLTLWLTNLMMKERPLGAEIEGFLGALPRLSGTLVLVSNEVGLGVVPTDAMARAFIDHAGRLHQRIAEQADVVVLMAAGLPLHLKSPSDA
jgi:adenosylcobinamide kinase / adenosylcobinamide-phosphate guanylyltransferase